MEVDEEEGDEDYTDDGSRGTKCRRLNQDSDDRTKSLKYSYPTIMKSIYDKLKSS